MITREKIFEFIKTLPDADFDYPFKEDFFSAVLRRKYSRKWFGVLLKVPQKYLIEYGYDSGSGGSEAVNLKCPPDLRDFICGKYCGVLPAYHMNKTHWVSIVLSSDLTERDFKKLISVSYELTR